MMMNMCRFQEEAKQLPHLLLRFGIDQCTLRNYLESVLTICSNIGAKIALCETSLHCDTFMQKVGEPRADDLTLVN